MPSISALAKLLRNTAGRDWGFFSEEDDRMHIQTVDDKGASSKYWLEDRGVRVFTKAYGNEDDRKVLEAIRKDDNKNRVERAWVKLMIQRGKLTVSYNNYVVTLTAYPRTHNSYSRQVNLAEMFPGAFPKWSLEPPVVDLNPDMCSVRVGDADEEPDLRHDLYLPPILFHGER